MPFAFERFLRDRKADLTGIARQTRGDLDPEEMASEAWILADEIGRKRRFPFDWANKGDQDTLLAWLYNRLVAFAHKVVRYAARMDKGWDAEDGERMGEALARMLTAPAHSDPQLRQQAHDEAAELLLMVRGSYSQAAAYMVLLIRLEWDFAELASKLWIGVPTLRDRVRESGVQVRVQPSLFDGAEHIPEDFEPRARPRPPARPRLPYASPQEPLALAPAAS